jgi:hypothetical protein
MKKRRSSTVRSTTRPETEPTRVDDPHVPHQLGGFLLDNGCYAAAEALSSWVLAIRNWMPAEAGMTAWVQDCKHFQSYPTF